MDHGVPNWLVWIADEMDRLHDHPKAMDRLREYRLDVAGSERPHALAVRCGNDSATAAERAMVLVWLHDYYADDSAPDSLRQMGACHQWSPLLPASELPLGEEISLRVFTVWALRLAPETAGRWLHGLFDGLGVALAREAPKEESPQLAGPSDAAVRAYRMSHKRKAGKGGRKRNVDRIEFQCSIWVRWLRVRDSYAEPSKAEFCKEVTEEYSLAPPWQPEDLDNCRRAYENYPEHRPK